MERVWQQKKKAVCESVLLEYEFAHTLDTKPVVGLKSRQSKTSPRRTGRVKVIDEALTSSVQPWRPPP
jgi:hypothetical protein